MIFIINHYKLCIDYKIHVPVGEYLFEHSKINFHDFTVT